MKAEYINPFISAAFHVLKELLDMEPSKGSLDARREMCTSQQCNVIVGVTGKIEGQVIYGMSLITADRIASLMLGQPVKTFDHLAASAIGEMGNMITGNAGGRLADLGYACQITPPSIVRGTNVKISTLCIPSLVIPIELPLGMIEIAVSLQER
ncbi:MAG: chemotaxis protein CheX [Armatimonadetes bacterium]|nr:chemotaxis protein CheX [Armatimonadota bacterium]